MTAASAAPTTGAAPTPVLGLDLSLRSTGIASSLGWADIITAPKASGLRRLRSICTRIEAHVEGPTPYRLAVIEGPSYGHATQRGHDELAALRWMVRDLLDRQGLAVAIAPPASVKLWATGRGNADKVAVRDAMRAKFPGAGPFGFDEADAAALASLGAAWHVRRPFAPAEARALDGVDWPDREELP